MLIQAKKLMDSALKIASSENDVIWVDYKNNRLSLVQDASNPDICEPFPSGLRCAKGLIAYLEENGYIEYCGTKNYFRLTYKSFYYTEIQKEEIWNNRKRSIFIPLCVAILGSVAIELLKNAVPLVLLWLQAR